MIYFSLSGLRSLKIAQTAVSEITLPQVSLIITVSGYEMCVIHIPTWGSTQLVPLPQAVAARERDPGALFSSALTHTVIICKGLGDGGLCRNPLHLGCTDKWLDYQCQGRIEKCDLPSHPACSRVPEQNREGVSSTDRVLLLVKRSGLDGGGHL